MRALDVITIVLPGLMVGAELAVSAFVNPALWQLENAPQAQAVSLLASSLGRVMPVWYGLGLLLLALESFLHRGHGAFVPLLTATLIWAAVIVFTIVMLVPINNRIAALNTTALNASWKADHKRWDALHRVRIVLLIAALVAATDALVR